MNAYLTIMVTVLVITQVIRVTQNAISLHRQNNEVMKACKWIKDNDVSERDFEIQRSVFHMLYDKLKSEEESSTEGE